MKRMASVALQHPCTSGVSRIVVAQYWNLDDDVTYPAWPLLKNATYINGALHPGCRPVRSVVRFTPTVAFECLFKPSLKVGRPSTLGDRPPPPIRVAIRVAMRRAIELPYVENAFCYDEQPVVPERTTDLYFRGGLHIFGAGGKRVRHSLLSLSAAVSSMRQLSAPSTRTCAGAGLAASRQRLTSRLQLAKCSEVASAWSPGATRPIAAGCMTRWHAAAFPSSSVISSEARLQTLSTTRVSHFGSARRR